MVLKFQVHHVPQAGTGTGTERTDSGENL